MIRAVLLGIIRFYRSEVSRFIPISCRYYPTCSHYSEEAIAKYGPAKGIGLSALRILRCNQLFRGGYDPLV